MVKFNSFICQNHFKILGDEALWKSWVLSNCDSAFPLSCPTPKKLQSELSNSALFFFFLTRSNGEGKYFIGLLKHSLLQQCNFTASLLVCDPRVCHGAEMTWAWCWDLREGGRPQDPAVGSEWTMMGDVHCWSNHNTQGSGDWSETKLQGKTTAAVRQAGKLPRIRCYHHSN